MGWSAGASNGRIYPQSDPLPCALPITLFPPAHHCCSYYPKYRTLFNPLKQHPTAAIKTNTEKLLQEYLFVPSQVKIIRRSYSHSQCRVDNIQSCIRDRFKVYYLMMFTEATNRSFSPLARNDFKVSQEHSHFALTPETSYAQILMLRLLEMLFGTQ